MNNKTVPFTPKCGNISNKYYTFCIQDDLEVEIVDINHLESSLIFYKCDESKLK